MLLQLREDFPETDQLAIEIQLLARELAQLLRVRVSRRYELDDALLDPLRAQLEVERIGVTLGQHVLDLVGDLDDAAICAVEGDAEALVEVCCVLIHRGFRP